MKINVLVKYTGGVILFLTLSIFTTGQTQTPVQYKMPGSIISDPTVSLEYSDTLELPSMTRFSLPVRIVTGHEISAISLGFYYPGEYLEITDMEMTNGTQGFSYNVTDSMFSMAWSAINPIVLSDHDTVIILNMKTLDLSGLNGTIGLMIKEPSEFADKYANVIEGVVLEIPAIRHFVPEPDDSLSGSYVKVYPNPFDEATTVTFGLSEESNVRISVFNNSGIEMDQVTDATFPEGEHQVKVYAIDYAKGIYILKVEIRNSESSGEKVFKILNLR